jgi:hypothetical protein
MSLSYRFHPIDVDLPEHWRVIEIAKKLRRAAFGLYVAASCYSRKHKPGTVPRAYVEDDDPKVVHELVRVGLWIPRDDGAGWEIHNWEKKSPGRKKSSEPPGASTARVHKHREKLRTANDVTDETVTVTPETDPVTSSGTSISISKPSSSDLSSADQKIATGDAGGPPPWFLASVETAVMEVGPVSDVGARWRSYLSSRKRKGWSMNHEDAVGWLCDVVGTERRKRLDNARADTRQPLRNPEDAEWLKASGGDL